jgi:hypothetical protein
MVGEEEAALRIERQRGTDAHALAAGRQELQPGSYLRIYAKQTRRRHHRAIDISLGVDGHPFSGGNRVRLRCGIWNECRNGTISRVADASLGELVGLLDVVEKKAA